MSNSTTQKMYFPPPPKFVVSENESRKPIKINFSKPRASTDTTTSISTTNSDALQKPLKPTLKHQNTASTKRPRQWILLGLLILSFTILILSVIFAYCAALPHSDNLQGTANQTAASPTAVDLSSATSTPASPSATDMYSYRLLSRDQPLVEDTHAKEKIDAALAEDHQNAIAFTRPNAMTVLTLYTAALPLVTMFHTAAELLTSLVRPQTSQATKIGDMLLFRRQRRNPNRSRFLNGTFFSFIGSALICIGWIIIQMFWTNCEVLPFSGSPLATSNDSVCPIQIRGHSMGGVSELSVVKVVLGWIVVGLYAGYCGFLITRVGVLGGASNQDLEGGSRMGKMRRRIVSFRRPQTSRIDEAHEPERDRDDLESVMIGIDVGKERR